MQTSKIVPWVIVVVVLVGAAYLLTKPAPEGYVGPFGSTTSTGSSGKTNTNSGQVNTTPFLKVATDSKLGSHLVAANGMTLYTYTRDTDVSNCNDDCAANWPPYHFSMDQMVIGQGVDGAKVSTVARADGSVQLTYQGAPLYFYVNDKKPGDILGQNVGGVWFIVKP